MNNLKDLYTVQNSLQRSGYHDISRISQEIAQYSQESNIPLSNILKRIESNEPWEYIRGKADFRNIYFHVNPSTLIPRIETEQIVDIAKEEIAKTQYTDIVDVGTGSGCIIISLAKELSSNSFAYLATDISNDALNIAKDNQIGILNKEIIQFVNTDLIEDLEFSKESNVLIIANLPYIPTYMYKDLDKSVKDFEPRTALDGGEDGLIYYDKLFEQIKSKNLRCTVILEIEPSTLDNFSYLNPIVFEDQYNQKRFLLIRFS